MKYSNISRFSTPQDLYYDNVAGRIGEGAAAEYVAFRRIYHQLPSMVVILNNPKSAAIPADLSTQYAIIGAISRVATKDNFDAVCDYTDRFARELGIMAMRDIIKLCPAVKGTRRFAQWAAANSEVMI